MPSADAFRRFVGRSTPYAGESATPSQAPPVPPRATGVGTSQLIERLEASGDNPSGRADAWHQYLRDHSEEHAAAVERARHIVHRGNPADVVDLANELAAEHAHHAASRMSRSQART